MTYRLTKAQLREALGFDTDAALADFFEISRSAVAQWGDADPIPELRQLQAERMRPGLVVAAKQQSSNDTGPLVADIEVPDGGEAQCGRDVHGVKPASQDARAA